MTAKKQMVKATDMLMHLSQVIESRKPEHGGDPKSSYVASLFQRGENTILKKIGEEATEVALACKDADPQAIIYEVADLWFHTLIALSQYNLSPNDVINELARREGLSGLQEFAQRSINKS